MSEYIERIVPLLPGSPADVMLAEYPEIVRCRDCKHYQDHNFGSKLDWCRYFHYDVHLDGFCKWGERRSE